MKTAKHIIFLSIIAGATFVCAAVFMISQNFSRISSENIPTTTEKIVVKEYRHPWTGVVLDEPLEDPPIVYGVMVENSADAWPLAGIGEAFLVIEAPVEANIPRFITFFSADQAQVEKIGPVRSARPYYISWAQEFGGLYAHVGGSPAAIEILRNTDELVDFDEFFHGKYFWRDEVYRAAPHNVYTSVENLSSGAQVKGVDVGPDVGQGWLFAPDAPSGKTESVSVDWSEGTTYDVLWEYVAATNSYRRHQGSRIMYTQDGYEVLSNNVIVLETDISVIDEVGRRAVRTLGTGKAILAQNGQSFEATWKKYLATDRLRFYALDGKEIVMNAGKTWVEVVDSLNRATVQLSSD